MENGWCFSDTIVKKKKKWVWISKEEKLTEKGKQSALSYSYSKREYEKCFVIFKKLI